ncbi:MAG: DUF4367 domain-containing protein [Firmicutes bacterium]|nr:DUF4367 domain-containing protein [Bacillota bacterium]
MENKNTKADDHANKDKLMNELNNILKSENIGYAAQRRIKDIADNLSKTSDIPAFDSTKVWNNIDENMQKIIPETYVNKSAEKRIHKRLLTTVAAVLVVLFSLNMITLLYARTDIVTYIYDLHNGVLTVKRADYNIAELEKNSDARYFTSIADGVKYFGHKIRIPYKLPTEYKLNKVSCSSFYITISYLSTLVPENGIGYSVYSNWNGLEIEINDDLGYSTYFYNGIEYRFMKNNGDTVVQWIDNDLMYLLTGSVSEEEFKDIIKNMK